MALPAILAWFALSSGVVQALEFAKTDIFYELNATAGDLGIHVSLDAESWREVRIESPRGQKIAQVKPQGNLRKIGLSELFFEGSEPSLQDVSFAKFRSLFPEGDYVFLGKTIGNQVLRSTDPLTANLPCPVEVVSPPAATPVPPGKIVIKWKPAPGVYNPDSKSCNRRQGVTLVGYQVIAEVVNESSELLRIFSIDLAPDATEVQVPRNFFNEGVGLAGTEYKLEVLAIEEAGNKTITEHEFEVEGAAAERVSASAATPDQPPPDQLSPDQASSEQAATTAPPAP